MEQIKNIYNKVLSFIQSITLDKVKNILSLIGLICVLWFVFFFSFQRPREIAESQRVIDSLNVVIKQNNITFKNIEKRNNEILEDIEKKNKELADLAKQSKKYKKDYEKQIARLNSLDDDDVTDLFTERFSSFK
jgi:septal ring factor EnvC (AmiA/AmiB activator)